MSNISYVRLPLEGAFNVRELGGYPSFFGRATKGQAFLRADGLNSLTEKDIDYLIKYGLNSVVDLRSQDEILQSPNPLANHEGIDYINISMFLGPIGDITKIVANGKDRVLTKFYIGLLQKSTIAIKEIFDFFAAHKDGVTLYHCSAGKDRTGIVSALLLWLAGVDKFDILSNYQISYTNLIRNPKYIDYLNGEDANDLMFSRLEDLEPALQYISDNYGNAENYLLYIGVSKENIEIIRNKLV